MDMHPVVVLEMMDRLVDTVPEPGVKITWEGLRRTFQSNNAVTLTHLMVAGEEGDRAESLHDRLESLKQQVSELSSEKADLEAQIEELRERLRQIGSIGPTPSSDGFYTMEQFLAVLTVKLRRSYGWRTDYVLASQATEGCRAVQNETVQKWQNTGRVPDWAVEQIDKLAYRKRTGIGGVPWSASDEDFLAQRYLADPMQSNLSLAEQCEAEFQRPINVPSIKGALDRLRKKNKIPGKRPGRQKM